MSRAVTSPHRAPRKQQRQRDLLDWEVPRRDPAKPRQRSGRGDERHGGSVSAPVMRVRIPLPDPMRGHG